jgi:A/G-specific adenine glycosylase
MNNKNVSWLCRLLAWFDTEKRSMPWRDSKDPYHILVSEIMLQQTRVDQATPFYLRFIAKFPTIHDLASASQDEVLEVWNGLGYYRRGRFLQQCAQIITQDNTMNYPDTYEAWLKLPGIGRYTAGAVMSIAFNKPCPAVDGNVARVISRFKGLDEDVAKDSAKNAIELWLKKVYPLDRCGDFTQALMELGACVCFPKKPSCHQCPLADECYASIHHKQEVLPVKMKKTPPEREIWGVFVIEEHEDIMLVARKNEALLSDFWGLPMVKADTKLQMERAFFEKYHISVQVKQLLAETSHVFSHRRWNMKIYNAEKKTAGLVFKENSDNQGIDYPIMIKLSEIKSINIAKPFKKVLEILEKNQ